MVNLTTYFIETEPGLGQQIFKDMRGSGLPYNLVPLGPNIIEI